MECKLRDTVIYYEEAGSGRPLLMLHGGGLDHHHMHYDMEPIFAKRAGWRRIYPDMPGSGKSGAPEWITNQDQMLEAMLEFMGTVAPGQNFSIAGMSYGGYLARGMVYRKGAQIDGLLLVVPVIEAEREQRLLPQHQVIRQDEAFLAALSPGEAWLKEFAVVQSLDMLAYQRNVILPAIAQADRKFQERLEAQPGFSFDVNSLPEAFEAPTLILTGRFDPWCGYREAYHVLDNYPRATLAILDRAGHALTVEQNILFTALAGEWLDRVEEYVNR